MKMSGSADQSGLLYLDQQMSQPWLLLQELKAALNGAIAALVTAATAAPIWERLLQAVVVQPALPAGAGQGQLLPLFDLSYELHEVEVPPLAAANRGCLADHRALRGVAGPAGLRWAGQPELQAAPSGGPFPCAQSCTALPRVAQRAAGLQRGLGYACCCCTFQGCCSCCICCSARGGCFLLSRHPGCCCAQARNQRYPETLSFVRLLNALLTAGTAPLPQGGQPYVHFTRFARTQILGQLRRRQYRCGLRSSSYQVCPWRCSSGRCSCPVSGTAAGTLCCGLSAAAPSLLSLPRLTHRSWLASRLSAQPHMQRRWGRPRSGCVALHVPCQQNLHTRTHAGCAALTAGSGQQGAGW